MAEPRESSVILRPHEVQQKPMMAAVCWGAVWYSKNLSDGVSRHLLREDYLPVLFHTRREARAWIESKYGYIRRRPDLRREPHGWRLPTAERVTVALLPAPPAQHGAEEPKP